MLRALTALLLLALLGGLPILLALALDDLPRAIASTSLSVDDVENVQRLLRENDPRQLRAGEKKRVTLSERELNLVLRYALPEGASARLRLTDGLLSVTASTPVPLAPLGSYLNLDLVLAPAHNTFEPVAVNVGDLRLPRWVIRGLATLGSLVAHRAVPEVADLRSAVSELQVDPRGLSLVYEWRPDLLERLKDRGQQLAMPGDDLQRATGAYYAVIATWTNTAARGTSLAPLLNRLFLEAARRSRSGVEPRDEHRALLLALGLAVQGADPNRLPEAGEARLPVLRPIPVTLHGRRDLAQHFAISAALAAGATGGLADVVGVFKELSDSQGGSGFSFPDLLADRAGVVLAERATGDAAATIQTRLAGRTDEALFMPPIDRLPEGLQNAAFRLRYEDIDTDAYEAVRGEVERRIAALPLYRP